MPQKATRRWFPPARVARSALCMADVWLSRHLHTRPHCLPVLLAFVTDRCNLRCPMCGVYEHDEPDASRELSTDEWKAVLDSAGRLRTIIVSISGGEPLLRKDIFEIVSHAEQREIAVHVCTNGTMIDADNAAELQASGVKTVSVSVEGTSAEVHERLRGPGTFEKTIEGIRLLREHAPGIRVGINTLITTENYRGLDRMIPFAEKLGVHQIKFAPIHTNLLHKRNPLEKFSDLIFDRDSLEGLEQEVAKIIHESRRTRLFTTTVPFLKGVTDLYCQPRKFRCFAGHAACAVDPQGMVAPCCDIDRRMSVRERPLHEIWRSREFHDLRKKVYTCRSACWDTTNTELSLRLSARSMLKDIPQALKDAEFYF